MGHPRIENTAPFVFEMLFLADEGARPLFVPVVKATYSFPDNGQLVLVEKPMPVNPAGEFWGDPNASSYKYEPETAFIKPATDVVLIGHAHAPRNGTKETLVSLQVGSLKKIVKVLGDRIWGKVLGKTIMTNPVPFEKIPLLS